MTGTKKHLISVLVLAVLSLALYAGTVRNGFVYDDEATIVANSFIKTPANLWKLLQDDYFSISGEMTYRPVVTLSYFIDYAIYGLNPWGYHLTNIILHAANVVLFYSFLVLLSSASGASFTSKSNLPFLSSLIFAFHPVLTETVEAVSFREDLLAFMCVMGGLNTYLYLSLIYYNHRDGGEIKQEGYEKRKMAIYSMSCIIYFFALLSKEMAATMPLIILCYEYIYRDEQRSIFRRPAIFYIAGYILVTCGYLFIRFLYFYNPAEEEIFNSFKNVHWSFTERLFTFPWLIISYIKLALFPVSLSADYEIEPVSSVLHALLPAAALVGLISYAFLVRKRQRETAFSVMLFLISLLPVYNIIPLMHPFAERYMYLPSAGFAIIAGHLFSLLIAAEKYRTAAYISLALLFISYGITVIGRHEVWKEPHALWSDTLRKMPESSLAHNNLGLEYAKLNEWDMAITEYRTAIRMNPSYGLAYNNLGIAYAEKKMVDEAISEYEKAIRLVPKYADAHYNLGIEYATRGLELKDYEMAVNELQIAVSLKPDDPDYHFVLAYAYDKLGDIRNSAKEYEAVLELNPKHIRARQALAEIYRRER